MNTAFIGALLCALSFTLVACDKSVESPRTSGAQSAAMPPVAAPAPMPAQAFSSDLRSRAPADTPERSGADVVLKRHVAVRHQLQLATDAASVESAWRAANEACDAAACDILSSTLARDDSERPASASLEARMPLDKVEGFLARVTALGTLGQHNKTAEDKSDEVIDVDARIRNVGEFRDNLRRLMATHGAKLTDVIEVERELVRVQAELDSLSSRRKALANQTEKVHVLLNIQARPALLQQGMWTPVHEAALSAGRLFASSIAALVSVLVAVLPWTLLLAACALAVRVVRRRAVWATSPAEASQP